MTTTLLPPRTDPGPRPELAPEPLPAGPPRRGTAERAAVVAAALAMVFQPILQPTGPGHTSPVDLFTLATLLFTGVWAATSGRRLGAPYVLPMALLIIGGGIAGLAGPLPGTSLLQLVQDLVLIAWTAALYNLGRRPHVLGTLTAAFAYSAIGWAALLDLASVAHISAIEGISEADGNRLLFTFGDPNYAAAYWVVAILVVYATCRPRRRAARLAGYTLLLWAFALSESNGGLLELVIAVVFVAAVRMWRRHGLVPAIAMVLVTAALLTTALNAVPLGTVQNWAAQSGQPLLVNSIGRSDNSTSQRSTLIAESMQLYFSDGVLGSGPRTTKQLLTDRQYPYAKEAHDDYLAALTERGPLGVIGIVMLVLAGFLRSSRVLRAPPGRGAFGTQVPRPAGLVAALLAMGVAGAYYQVLHFRFVWILLAFVAVLAAGPARELVAERAGGLGTLARIGRGPLRGGEAGLRTPGGPARFDPGPARGGEAGLFPPRTGAGDAGGPAGLDPGPVRGAEARPGAPGTGVGDPGGPGGLDPGPARGGEAGARPGSGVSRGSTTGAGLGAPGRVPLGAAPSPPAIRPSGPPQAAGGRGSRGSARPPAGTTQSPRGGTGTAGLGRRSMATNLAAQGAALLVVSVASLLVARLSGAAVLGEYTLLRVLPWLVGVVVSCGLPVASTYFLAARPDDRRLRPTLTLLGVASALLGTALWVAMTPLLQRALFSALPKTLIAFMGVTVATQLLTVWAKACCQGRADMRGANLVIVCEELLFLPAYAGALALGMRGIEAVAAGMVVGGLAATVTGLARLALTGFGRDWARPSRDVAGEVLRYGARGQLGNVLMLVNLRLDFVVLGAIAGPAVLGVYAVASKFAELMRLPAAALNYVLYPRFAREEPREAAADARHLLPRALLGTLLLTPVVAGAAVVALPVLYGRAFHGAVVPALILLIGLAVEGAAAVSSAYLCGAGRPGANSLGMGMGVVITVVLDVLLIPRHGAVGAAVASSAAYLVTTCMLTTISRAVARRADEKEE
ncbi:oligosaccharide flippase family protein [Streptacidiphilus jiangxiensis]|uniref:Membrane protein involved in the export of O-antigen and teichoic acid n=1 Tax=Streptacidiphilus jiangxiensis TaxID=235985 RepID=A0A1H7QQ68_STRJI|nr:oligosaccharide flippase family protein [Streptacidiphilus jiangxiensis]SEL49755.1 Membrane protein involved in the export of O-antigen and teichoic acid [Streptacidiphilus jiangxiensis]